MGKTVRNRDLEIPFVYKPCGRWETCNDTSDVEGPGCYCPEGNLLNPATGLCVKRSETCPGKTTPEKDLNLREL